MLHQLRSRLHAAEFSVHFTIVSADISDDDTMVELRQASQGIPIVPFDALPESFGIHSGWNRYSNDIMVIDSCGRQTYQVVMPWSSLQYPYVKAAIISTLIDQPCGPCNTTEKKPKHSESPIQNSTLHEMQKSKNKTQSKLVSIVGQYMPRLGVEKTAKVKDHLRDVEENTYISGETSSSGTEAIVTDSEQEQPIASTSTTEHSYHATHSNAKHEDIATTESTEKMSKGKKKLSSKKYRSKHRTKHVQEEEITEEKLETLPESDLELEKSMFSFAENFISSEVTLAPLRETKDGLIPIRVIMRSPHEHDGKTYDYLEMQLGNPGYHGHLGRDQQERELDLEREQKELQDVEDGFDAIGDEDKKLGEDLIKGGDVVSGYKDLDVSEQDEKPVINEDKDSIVKLVEDRVIDAVKVERTTSKSEVSDKNKDTKRKNKKTENSDKKSKGNKTKLTNIPEQDWMKAESKDLPDEFDDIYSQVKDFENDVREEESNHKNEESILDDLTVSDLKYLIKEMGLEVNATKQDVNNETVANNYSSDYVVKSSQSLHNASGELTNEKQGHHKSVINAVSVTEKPDKAKDLKGKETEVKEKASDEIVNRKKVNLTPTLSESNSEATSGSDGSSKEVMEHYSKLLPWIDYHL